MAGDNRRVSNGDQVSRVATLALKRGKRPDVVVRRHGTKPGEHHWVVLGGRFLVICPAPPLRV